MTGNFQSAIAIVLDFSVFWLVYGYYKKSGTHNNKKYTCKEMTRLKLIFPISKDKKEIITVTLN